MSRKMFSRVPDQVAARNARHIFQMASSFILCTHDVLPRCNR